MAKFNDYKIAQTSFRYEYDLFRALADGTGFVIGDILKRTQVVNESTQLVSQTIWENLDQGSVLGSAPTIGTDVEALDTSRVSLDSETVVIGASGTSLATIPSGATLAEIHVLDADIVFTLDGTTVPVGGVSPVGYRQGDGQTFELESKDEIDNFNAIRLGASDARIYVQYYREYLKNA